MSRQHDDRQVPDHGRHFVPGGETAPDLAPQPLDHFKRGYRERADQRDRETDFLHGDFHSNRDDRRGSFQDHRVGATRGGGGYPDRRGNTDRSQVIMGFDVQAFVDRLCYRNADVFRELDMARSNHSAVFNSGKSITAIISNLARRRNLNISNAVWEWVDRAGIQKNTFHYNSMISCCEKVRDYKKAIHLLDEMRHKNVPKNEVTFSSAISACEKCGQWREALDLLDQMKREGAGQTAIAYNAAISACEKGLVPHKALEIFEQMKQENIKPTVVTYSALISAAEKGQQWRLALEVLEEMKAAGHGANVIAYSAAISACSKGQMWQKALELFREIEAMGGKPSIVTYNATMTALEKGLQWERALDLFDEMKNKNMQVTVVSYGSAISACEKGLQYRQCLEFLDEMTEMGIKKNVIIFGAAMSCMEKSCRADIAFQLMERMKLEGVAPNVHIYNSAISACARCNMWEKGYELFQEMDRVGVKRDVVTYNAVLDAVCSEVQLGRRLFKEGVEKGFYSRVSRLGTQWLELDLHFLSLGGGEIALGWWFEECLVPYLVNTSKLEAVQSISIVTGYGKTRTRGIRLNDDGMRLRVKAMLKCMGIEETPQANKGRIHVNKAELVKEVQRKNGKIIFDADAYTRFKAEETTANKYPDVPQILRPRFRPVKQGEGPAGTFIREGDPVEPQPPLSTLQGSPAPSGYSDRRRSSYGGGGDQDGRFRGRSTYGRDRHDDRRRHAMDDRRGTDYSRDRTPPNSYGYSEYQDRRSSYQKDSGAYHDNRDYSNHAPNGNVRDSRPKDRRSSYQKDSGAYHDNRDYSNHAPNGNVRDSRPIAANRDEGRGNGYDRDWQANHNSRGYSDRGSDDGRRAGHRDPYTQNDGSYRSGGGFNGREYDKDTYRTNSESYGASHFSQDDRAPKRQRHSLEQHGERGVYHEDYPARQQRGSADATRINQESVGPYGSQESRTGATRGYNIAQNSNIRKRY